MTEKLYYTDQYMREFDATVLSCELDRTGWHVVLDKTAFYPEGGGQPGDTGEINGVPVLDTQEKNGLIDHLCPAEIGPGTHVHGKIDWQKRFDLMQQHSGEHIVSGIVHSLYGYENVGFHMGSEAITIDLSGVLDAEQLKDIERRANEIVWSDKGIEISWPDAEQLKSIPYRSKKELTGPVRIVNIPGTDVCACCGTHVSRTGEIGTIKLLSCQKFRGGVRIEMLCGKRAYDYLSAVCEQNRGVSAMLSAKPLATAGAVKRMKEELERANYRLVGYENIIFEEKAKALSGDKGALVFESGLSPESVRKLCAKIIEHNSGMAAVFSESADGGWKYCVGKNGEDIRAFVKSMNYALSGRGGGSTSFAQGSVCCRKQEIESFFEDIIG